MIRSAPSISTTGRAGPSSMRKYGRTSASRAAFSCSRRSWVRAFAKTSMRVSGMGRVDYPRLLPHPRAPGLDPLGCAAVIAWVRPVRWRRDLRRFIALQYRLHAGSPRWIPPLRLERRLFLSPRFNAYFKHAEAQLFVALRDGRVVGRISAQV